MSAFTSRTSGYKAGVFLLFFASIVFIVGYASPYWASAELTWLAAPFAATSSEGLWMMCLSLNLAGSTETDCVLSGLLRFPGWFHAVRAMECIGVIGVVVSCIYTLATNCCRTVSRAHTRFLEKFAGVTGTIAFVGCVVYGVVRNNYGAIGTTLSVLDGHEWKFLWAFYLAAVGSGLFVVAAILIAVYNKPVGRGSPEAGMVMTIATRR